MQHKIITNIVAVIGLIMTGFFASCESSDSVSAYSLTISTSSSLTANVIPSADGSIGTTVVTDNVSIASDCRAGYTLTIKGPTNRNLYLNGNSANNASGTYFTPVDGTSALNASANANKWGYSLTADSGTDVFSALPTVATTLKTPSQTASPNSDINTIIPIYYGTSVNGSMAPGSYTFANNASITYAAVMDTTCTSYSVQYQDNGADNPNGMGTTDATTGEKSVKQTNIAEDTKITLLAPNFKKTGYAFLGWSTDSQAYAHFTDNDNTNDPVIYGPMEDVIIDADIMATANARNQINMYAVWMPALKDGNNNPVYMQEWDNPNTTLPHDGCSTLTATVFDDTVTDEKGKIIVTKNSVVALTDKRDNEVYTVARLADGNCWMTENLRLDNQYTMGQNQNDPTVTNQYLSQGYGGTTDVFGNFVGLAEPESENFDNMVNTANNIYKSSATPAVDTYDPTNNVLEDIGADYNPNYRFPRYNNDNTQQIADSTTYTQDYANALSPSDSGTNYRTSSNLYSYGNYYTQSAAVANTSEISSVSEEIGTSICPSGWYLPSSGTTTKEYSVLSQSYGGTGNNQNNTAAGGIMSNRFRTFPNSFLYSGFINGSLVDGRGSNGYYRSRSLRGDIFAYELGFFSNGFRPSISGEYTTTGDSVRCLASPSDVEIILDSNNATGAISRIYGEAGSTITLPASSIPSAAIAQSGYGFKNWNTAPDGSGTTYTYDFTIPAGSTGERLYAQWDPHYSIFYVNNCMTWASNDANCTQELSDVTIVQRISLDASGNGSGYVSTYSQYSITGWKIKEWTTNADGSGTAYPVASTYAITGANAGDGIMLYAHWVPVYTVQYDGNGSDNDATGMGSTDSSTGLKSVKHINVSEGDTFDLFASNFKKAGYGFVGWSTDANAWSKLTDNDTTNDVRIWGPNERFTAPAYNGTTITTLYAVWAPAKTSGGNPVYLQGWTGCSAMTATTYDSATGTFTVSKNSIIALTDQRDNQVYTVAKLTDGSCWMIENLRLADTHVENGNTVATVLSTANTNILSSDNTLPITNIYNADPSLAVKSNSLSQSSNQFISNDPSYGWCNSTAIECVNQSRLNSSNTTSNTIPSTTQTVTSSNKHTNFKANVYAYGNYYNYYSATVGYGARGRTNTGEDIDGDICPKGWKLPSGVVPLARSMNAMSATVGNQASLRQFTHFPNNFIFGGYQRTASYSSDVRGEIGYYWSSDKMGDEFGEQITIHSSGYVYTGSTGTTKEKGSSVRCVSSL